MSGRTAGYVSTWGVLAVLSSIGWLAWVPRGGGPLLAPEVGHVLLFLAVTTAAEATTLMLDHGKSKEVVTLVEAAVAVNILLFPPVAAFGITVGGIAFAHTLHRRPAIKVAFNTAQYATASVAALSVHALIAGGAPALDPRSLAGLVAGTTAFGLVNSAAVSGIVSILQGKPFVSVMRSGLYLTTLTVYGNTAAGIIAVVVWTSRPELSILLVVPLATLHLAYRGTVRSRQLLETVVAERDRLSRIVVGASDGIVLVDSEGRVDVWSPAMEQMTGINESEARGRLLSEVMTGHDSFGDPVDPLAPLAHATLDSPVTVVEMVLPHRQGDERIVRARHTNLFDGRAALLGDAVIVHDVTHDYEVERMKDDFLARVSHELRTPLTPIKGYAQALLRRGKDVPQEVVTEGLTRIVERVDHMTLLVDDLLLVAKMITGHANLSDQIQPAPFDVAALCEKCIAPFRAMQPGREVTLMTEAGPTDVIADATRVEQILANLVSNACKYSEEQQPITVSIHDERGWIAVAVTDRGRGIPEDQLDKIFERFHRVENPLTMTTGGIGLGLHITRLLAQAMGGTLTVRSRLGHGSTFTLRLPHAEAAERS